MGVGAAPAASGRLGTVHRVAVRAGAAAKASPVGFLPTVFLGATLLALAATRCSMLMLSLAPVPPVPVPVREQRNHLPPDSLHAI